MDVKVNGVSERKPEDVMGTANGHALAGPSSIALQDDLFLREIESELPIVYDGQIEMRELLSRMMQSIYAELTEMAETCVLVSFK